MTFVRMLQINDISKVILGEKSTLPTIVNAKNEQKTKGLTLASKVEL